MVIIFFKGESIRIASFYIGLIVAVNYVFAHTVPIETPLGMLPPATFIVGMVFVVRDFVQRQIGHWVILPMLMGCALSYLMASPVVATASLTAFLLAELSDWGIYTALKTEFHRRVLFSSMLGVLVDTCVFLPMVGFFSWGAVLMMWCSKMVAAVAVWGYYKGMV